MIDRPLLMGIQYDLPLSTTPLVDLAEDLGRDFHEIEKELIYYKKIGILKRYGLNLNYKAFRKFRDAALVALKANDVEKVSNAIANYDKTTIKHCYLRECEYNIWFTVKAESLDGIERIVNEVIKSAGSTEHVILPTKRIYKMNVKYDLYRGISWSRHVPERKDPVPLVELGFDENVVKSLESLRVCERPFKEFKSFGYEEEEVLSMARELLKKGVARDFSGVLDESRIGFKENGMVVLNVDNVGEVATKLLDEFPQITHLIERVPSDKWNFQLYFMVHAIKKHLIDEIVENVRSFRDVKDLRVIYSIRDLRA